MVDFHLTPSPSSPQPTNALRTDERLRLLERREGDELAAVISKRMVAAERPRPPIIEAPARMSVVNAMGATLLTPRQEQVVGLVADGMNNREIARELNLSEHTIKKYLNRIFEKLGISTRVELVLYAVNNSGHRQEGPPAPATRSDELLERSAAFLNELLLDDRIAPSEIVAAKTLHDEIMAACKKPVASVAENGTLRAQGRGHRERRHTQTFLQPMGLAVYIKGEPMLCAVRQHFLLSHPREVETLTWWFPTVEAAQKAFPNARLLTLPDYKKPEVPRLLQVQQVAPRLAAAPPVRVALPQPGGRA
jgi:DNA-binding CsgD family transcriptional regulator